MRPLSLLLLIALLAAAPAQAQRHPEPVGRAELVAANVGITGLMALARGVATGNVKSVPDGLVVLGTGAAAGLGFYEAKRLIGQERQAVGTALAFASASVVENVASGEHPLGYVRFGPGPFDVRVRTPLATSAGPPVRLELDPFGAAGLFLPLFSTYEMRWCGVTLCYVTPANPANPEIWGHAVGRLLLLSGDVGVMVETHELIHYVQALQVSAVTPYGSARALGLGRPDGSVDFRLDWLYSMLGLASSLQEYHERWSEIEAHSLHARPAQEPRCPGGRCFFPQR